MLKENNNLEKCLLGHSEVTFDIINLSVHLNLPRPPKRKNQKNIRLNI